MCAQRTLKQNCLMSSQSECVNFHVFYFQALICLLLDNVNLKLHLLMKINMVWLKALEEVLHEPHCEIVFLHCCFQGQELPLKLNFFLQHRQDVHKEIREQIKIWTFVFLGDWENSETMTKTSRTATKLTLRWVLQYLEKYTFFSDAKCDWQRY